MSKSSSKGGRRSAKQLLPTPADAGLPDLFADEMPEDHPLSVLSCNPEVLKALEENFSPSELDYLVKMAREGTTLHGIDRHLLPNVIVNLRTILRDSRARQQRINQIEDERRKKTERDLGARCPPLQRRLFEALRFEWGLKDQELVGVVFKTAAPNPSDLDKLPSLVRALNDRLRRYKSDWRAKRPADGWLMLCRLSEPKKLADAQRELQQPAQQPETRQAVPRMTVDECMTLMREYISTGPQKGSSELDEFIKTKGYSEATIRRARKKLGVKTAPAGFGRPWVVSLPA